MAGADGPRVAALERAAAWRRATLEGFRARAEALAAGDESGELAALLSAALDEVGALSAQVDRVSDSQAGGERPAPWWADGEYDDAAADAANERGKALHARGEYASALTHFTEAARLSPGTPAFWNNRAAAASRCGRPDLAAESSRRAVSLDPGGARAHARLVRALIDLGDAPGALSAVEDWAASLPWDDSGRRAPLRRAAQALASLGGGGGGGGGGGPCAPAVPWEGVPEEVAVERWEAAEGMRARAVLPRER